MCNCMSWLYLQNKKNVKLRLIDCNFTENGLSKDILLRIIRPFLRKLISRTFLNNDYVDFRGVFRPCQTSKTDRLLKIVIVFQSLTTFAKVSILDVWKGSVYTHENQQ